MSSTREYKEEDFPHPGEVLRKELEEIGLSHAGLARYIGSDAETITQLCQCQIEMTPVIACKIARALGTSPRQWLELQINYNLARVDKNQYESIKPLGAEE